MNSSKDELVRLNKYIAQRLAIGRRQADFYIENKRVAVNGEPAGLGMQIKPMADVVEVDGKPLQAPNSDSFTYLALNKPVGYVCSRKQQGDNPTIYSLLPQRYHHLKPVGRLDKDSSGLLLLTNDGDFTHRMTHPSFIKIKCYEVVLSKPLAPLHQQMITDYGIQLDDGTSKLQLEKIHEDNKNWIVTMHEGRNRQIRRTFAALHYSLNKLHRIQFGNYALEDSLSSGNFTEVTADR